MNEFESPKTSEEITRKAEVIDVPIILNLLRENLGQYLPEDSKKKEGFLSFNPTEAELAEIINDTGVVINMKGNELKGYFITLSKDLARKSSFWNEMLDNAESMDYEGKKIGDYNYALIGQICVAKAFRGGMTFNRLYYTTSSMLKEKGYEVAIGEIASDNAKSLAVHSFLTEIGTYESNSGIKWHVMILDLSKD
jgi:predicted GNAT superfamily acetyltransferase